MKKVFIFGICSTCGEPSSIVEPCELLGFNDFPETNFHGELSVEETERLREHLIFTLIEHDKIQEAEYVLNNTKVFEIEFKM